MFCNNRSGPTTGTNDSRIQELTVEKGTIHTKRHSGEDPIKTGCVNYSDSSSNTGDGTNWNKMEKIRLNGCRERADFVF